MIMNCTCIHKAQDEFHGKGKRVFNERKGASARCTVCGRETPIQKEVKVKGKSQ